MPLQPKHLDYVNTQFLLIGHKDNALEKATEPQNQDEGEGKDKPLEEMEKLEHEDQIRVEHLKGNTVAVRSFSVSNPLTECSQEMTPSLWTSDLIRKSIQRSRRHGKRR